MSNTTISLPYSREPVPGLEPGTSSLPRKCSTAELHRHLYSRNETYIYTLREWAVMDSNHRRRKPAELQSAPFGHSGNCPSVHSAPSLIYYHSSEWEGRSAFSCKHTNPQEGIQESRTKVHTKSEITKLLAKKTSLQISILRNS